MEHTGWINLEANSLGGNGAANHFFLRAMLANSWRIVGDVDHGFRHEKL